jgi:hypothetical protein
MEEVVWVGHAMMSFWVVEFGMGRMLGEFLLKSQSHRGYLLLALDRETIIPSRSSRSSSSCCVAISKSWDQHDVCGIREVQTPELKWTSNFNRNWHGYSRGTADRINKANKAPLKPP